MNKTISKIFSLIIGLFVILTLSSCKKETLIVYTEAGFAPFEYVAGNEIVGVDVDIMNQVGKKLGKKVVFKNVSFDIIVDAVSQGKLTNVGAAGLSITDERLEKVDFSKVYYTAKLYVIYNKEAGINSKEMTDGKTGVYWSSLKTTKGIGVQGGTTADLFLSDEITTGGSLDGVKKTDFQSLGVAVSAIGKTIDYVIIDELPSKYLVEGNDSLARLPLYYEGENGEEDILAYDQYAICVTKGQDELLNAINEVLDELLVVDENGESGIDKLVNGHLGVTTTGNEGLIKNIFNIFFVKQFRNYLLQGFINTLIITICAALIGLVIGFIVAIIKILAQDNKTFKWLAVICNLYTTIIRGTPVALQLFVMVLQIFVIPGRDLQLFAIILTFGINSGAYVSENIRAGIQSVDRGQMEAGRALGLSQMKTMGKIILPQAIKNVIPAIGNEMIALLKETSIISIIGSTVGTMTFDLTQASTTISIAQGGSYLPAAIMAGALYLSIVYLVTLIIKIIERRLHASDQR